MKNRRIVSIIYILIFVIIISFFYVFKYKDALLDKTIYDRNWYSYNNINGQYDIFYINNNKISYNTSKDDFDNQCSSYSYDKKNSKFNLNCDHSIEIEDISSNKLVLIIDGKKKVFYDDIKSSLNNEFYSYYSKSISEYNNDMNRVKDIIKINISEIQKYILDENYSKFVFIGDKCTSLECSISLDTIEKWITNTEDIYYIDSSNLSSSNLNMLYNIDNKFSLDFKYYNNVYPLIIVTKNGKIVDSYYFNCLGYNCSKYDINEF